MLPVASGHVDELRAPLRRRGQRFSQRHLLEDLGEEVLAGVGLAEDGAVLELALEELCRQRVDVHGLEQRVEVLGPVLHIPVDPLDAGLVHLHLAQHLQAVLADQLQQLAVAQAEELLRFGDLWEGEQHT